MATTARRTRWRRPMTTSPRPPPNATEQELMKALNAPVRSKPVPYREAAAKLCFGGPFPFRVDAGSFQDALDTHLAGGGRLVEVASGHEEWCEAVHLFGGNPAPEDAADQRGEGEAGPVRLVAVAAEGEDPAGRVAAVTEALRVPRVAMLMVPPSGMAAAGREVERGTAESFGLDLAAAPEDGLEALLDAAPEGLAQVRFPMSLLGGTEPLWRRDCAGGTSTAAEVLRARGVLVGASSPIDGGEPPQRLVTFPPVDGASAAKHLKEALDIAAHLELQYRDELHPSLTAAGVSDLPPLEDVAWAQILAANLPHVLNWVHWEEAYHKQLRPCLGSVLSKLRRVEPAVVWMAKYRIAMNQLMRRVSEAAQHEGGAASARLSAFVDEACPALDALGAGHSLEGQALAALLAAGVDVVTTHAHARGRMYGRAVNPSSVRSHVLDAPLPDRRDLVTVLCAADDAARAVPREEACALLERLSRGGEF